MLAAVCWKVVGSLVLICGLPDNPGEVMRQHFAVMGYQSPPSISQPFIVTDADLAQWLIVLALARNVRNP